MEIDEFEVPVGYLVEILNRINKIPIFLDFLTLFHFIIKKISIYYISVEVFCLG